MKKSVKLLFIPLSILLAAAIALGIVLGIDAAKNLYTVTFETYGGTPIEPYTLKEGEEIVRPADPQKTLFTFAGWYADEEFTQEFDFAQRMPKNDVTVYAGWTSQKSSRVVYDSMDGTPVPSSVGAVGSRLTMPASPTKEGYTFAGWYTTPECNDDEYFSFTVYPEKSVTLYARWDDDPDYAYITYYGNDEPITRIPVKKDTPIADPDLFPEEGDLAYTGWYTDTSLNNSYSFGENATGDLSLYTSFYTEGLVVENGAVTGYTGISSSVIVPNRFNKTLITSIGEAAFRDNDTVTQIDLPDAVASVGAQAFYGCRYLVSVNLTKQVTTIGPYAFFNCSRLTSYGDISGLTAIPDGLFLGCRKLSAITLSESVTSVGAQAFADCELLKEMALPAGVTQVSNGLFDGCASLEKVTFGGALTDFGTNVFSGCPALTSVVIPEGGSYSVSGRDLYHNNTARGAELVFHISGGETETEYTLPANVTVIKAGAFEGNTALKTVTVGASVRIECGAFGGMRALETLTAPAFDRTNNYLAYYFGAAARETGTRRSAYIPVTLRSVTFVGGTSTTVGNSAFCGAVGLEEVSGLDTVTSIGAYAFAYTALKSFTVSPQLTSIGDYAFTGCPQLEEYKMTGQSSFYSVYGGCLYNANGTQLLAVPSAKTSIEFAESITTIKAGAFTDSAVEEVVVPDSVTTLEFGAFSNSFALRSLSVPFIGGSATANNYMAYIFGTQISYTVDRLDDGTRYQSAGIRNMGGVPSTLTELTVRKKYNEIPDGAFAMFSGLSKVNFPEDNGPITKFGKYSFCNTAIEEIDLSHATSIGDYAFMQVPFTEVTLPGTLTEFGVAAFAMNTSLESIELEEGITSIPAQAFRAHSAITDLGTGEITVYTSYVDREIKIPASVTAIGMEAFEGVGMQYDSNDGNVPNARFAVTFVGAADGTSELATIGMRAFSHTGIQTVAIPASVTEIGKEAFSGCSALETVTVGSAEKASRLAEFGALSFSACTSLETVTLYASQLVTMEPDEGGNHIFYDASEDYTVTIVATDDIFGLFQNNPNWSNLGTTSDGDPRLIHQNP